MSDRLLSREEFQSLVQPLIGLPVSLPWKGFGSAIFLELGKLAPLDRGRRHHNAGEACIAVSWDWRVEKEASILYGSSNSGPEIDFGIRALRDATLEDLAVTGQVPELVVRFSNGYRLCSMAMLTGDPKWSIRLRDGKRICARRGELLIRDGGGASELTEQERAAFDLAELTADRWGVPVSEPRNGLCGNCAALVRIDGHGHLLDYGVCLAEASPFFGRAVNRESGCPSFTSKMS